MTGRKVQGTGQGSVETDQNHRFYVGKRHPMLMDCVRICFYCHRCYCMSGLQFLVSVYVALVCLVRKCTV